MLRYCLLLLLCPLVFATELPQGYWGPDRVKPILDKTLRLHLAPDLSGLKPKERITVGLLLEVGEIFHDLYLDARHAHALEAGEALRALDRKLGSPKETQDLLDLYHLFRGPIATTVDNQVLPFLPVEDQLPTRNIYPKGTDKTKLDLYLAQHPERRAALMHVRGVVREATPARIAADLATLTKYPDLMVGHPGLREQLEGLQGKPQGYYGLPYSVAYAPQLHKASRLLWTAAETISELDPDFASYLHLRARDLLADDYEGGDAAWITGRFKRLNAQIGSYETYDDKIYGVKSFFSLSLLLRDEERSRTLRKAIKGLQALEDRLPYRHQKKVREDIPVGVYQVIADYGQARGTNTATILPNEHHIARKYGRTILLRHNILTNPEIYGITSASWAVAVAPEHVDDMTLDANFHRTLWHEIGHYLGVDRDQQGRSLDVALAPYSDLMEELKADLVSLFAVPSLTDQGYHNARGKRAVYAAGIYRTLQKVKPRRSQPYQCMQLLQMNYYLNKGLLRFDEQGRLAIDYAVYPAAVAAMLKEVLALQRGGDPEAVAAFVDRYFIWEAPHEKLAQAMRAAGRYQFRLVTYDVMKP